MARYFKWLLWALLAPIGALVVSGWRESVPWFIAYIIMTAVSGTFDYFLDSGESSGMSPAMILTNDGLGDALKRKFPQSRVNQ